MENQQLVEYIVDQMRVGYSEATLREHLEAHGWSAEAIDGAFVKYHRLNTAELKAARAARRKARRHKLTRFQRIKAGTVAAVVAVLLAIGINTLVSKHAPLVQAATKPLTYAQKQSNDVNILAGAVAQYAAEAEALPTVIGANPDGSITLCGAGCGAISPIVASLGVYKPTGINFAPYSAGLAAPDRNTMYLVPGATCASKTALGEANPKPRSMVILYAQANGASLARHCVVL
ncbi:MAG TPA: hypothetical protein VLG92_00390 [Candidatus Saccharimonadia bacterium]|nr:hypothetical protein [Candidatus Saccharimonadia bacterium]